MDQRDMYSTPEPHFLPGYTGHCSKYRFRIGETYGHATHRALMEPVSCKYSGRLVISDMHQTVKSGTQYRHPLMEVKSEFSHLNRSTKCNEGHPTRGICPEELIVSRQVNSEIRRNPCAPRPLQCTTYPPSISEGEMVVQPRDEWYRPRNERQCFDHTPCKGRHGCDHGPCTERDVDVHAHCPICPPLCERYGEREVLERSRQPLHPRPPPKNLCAGGRFVLADIRPDIAADFLEDVPCPEPSFLPPSHSTSPYFMEIGHPEKTFKYGYTGHVPFSHGAYGKTHDSQVRSQLAEFTSNYRHRQSQEWAPAELGGLNTYPRLSAGTIIYPTHVGLIPKYGGHVPGETFRYGRTYGNATRDAKRWLRGDFS
ncbi:CIMIP2 protein CG18335 [Hetaerina americana]|uniref:CIMIP2 protein CG18335 n=1 Tax=Hetaerina americana TaxID=62018 RepID=UPI003A7F3668